MSVKLYEGCWGVTRGGEKRGQMVPNQNAGDPWPFKIVDASGEWVCAYRKDGTACSDIFPRDLEPHNDIIAVFGTEAEADAYLAQESHKPLGQIVREEHDRLRAKELSGVKHAVNAPSFTFAPAPKPVTWPDRRPHSLSPTGEAMSDAPERMFVRSKPNGAMGRWHDATSDAEIAAMTSDGTNPMVAYILAPPEALAASPEVAALIAEARREAEAKLVEWQASQHYAYIGRDGKTVLASELEERAEAADAKVTHLEARIEGTAKDTQKLLIAAEAELATLRAQVERLTGALTIAANRLHRCSVDYDTGTREFIEVGGWADEARAALTEGAAP